MTDRTGDPDRDYSFKDKEFQDPHYHDEDPETQRDDRRPSPPHLPAKRKPVPRRLPPPKRRFDED
jgi:hypothetical protein